jgi:hypothetical protein
LLAAIGAVAVLAAAGLGSPGSATAELVAAAPAGPEEEAAACHHAASHDSNEEAAVASGATAASPAATSAPDAPVSGASGALADRFPNLVLSSHEGRSVRFYDDLLRGKIVLINFMYASCKRR